LQLLAVDFCDRKLLQLNAGETILSTFLALRANRIVNFSVALRGRGKDSLQPIYGACVYFNNSDEELLKKAGA